MEKKQDLKLNEFNKLIQLVIDAGIDIDKIASVILSEFKVKTEFSTKKFYKLSKNQDKKQILKFISVNIKPLWIGIVEPCELAVIDLRNHLDKDIFLEYLSGIYISIHSKRFENNIGLLIKSTLAEMFQRVAFKISEDNLLKKES